MKVTSVERTQIKKNISDYKRYDSKRFGQEIQSDEDYRTLKYEEWLELWIEQEGKCFYTGKPMSIGQKAMDSASLDRIDSDTPHTKWNTVLCHLSINYMKNSFTIEEFLVYLRDMGVQLSNQAEQLGIQLGVL